MIATSVVRSAHKGEMHGGVYLVDLESGTHRLVVDWAETDIEWAGRGHDRGLRGIAFHEGRSYIAASTELLVIDQEFTVVERISNPYLRHCHEIYVHADTLWATSTGFDSLLELDLLTRRFTRGICLRHARFRRIKRKLLPAAMPQVFRFDPESERGPAAADTTHINNVFARDGVVYCSGTGLGCGLRIDGDSVSRYAQLPLGTHNVRLYREGVLMHCTRLDAVRYASLRGRVMEEWKLPGYPEEELLNNDLPDDYARQRFGRGLCLAGEGEIIAGSSPATVSVFEHGDPTPKLSVNLSMDVRNAVHGLEVYPF
jgi:hypothetical protein